MIVEEPEPIGDGEREPEPELLVVVELLLVIEPVELDDDDVVGEIDSITHGHTRFALT